MIKIESRYKEKYIGQEKTMRNGLKAKIIKYVRNDDVDIEFEDGYIAKHKTIGNWKVGNIGHPEYNNNYINRTGETAIASNGMKMTIIRYNNHNDMDIQFEDGYIAYNKRYDKFIKGYIFHPDNYDPNNPHNYIKKSVEELKEERLGETTLLKTGEKVTIVDYRISDDITVQFEDGTIQKTRYSCFKSGYIHHPNKNFHAISFEEFLLADYLNDYGFVRMPPGSLKEIDEGFGMMEFDIYNPELKIAIEYDGPWHNKHMERDIRKDNLCQRNSIKIIRIRVNCITYPSDISKQISFKFHDRTYENFPDLITKIKNIYANELGYIDVCMPDINATTKEFYQLVNKPNSRLGESKLSKCGLKMTIVEYINSTNITVQFEDGYITKNRRYYEFCQNTIKHRGPEYVIPQNRIGEKVITGRGLEATIIAYRNSRDIDIRFSNGAYTYHRKYSDFKKEKILPDKEIY